MLVIYADSYLCVRKVALSLNEFSWSPSHVSISTILVSCMTYLFDQGIGNTHKKSLDAIREFQYSKVHTSLKKKCFAKVFDSTSALLYLMFRVPFTTVTDVMSLVIMN